MLSFNILRKQGLTQQELDDIVRLAGTCNDHESIDLKLNWDMLRKRPVNETNDFLCYAEDRLVGYLALYSFNSQETEISGMVHPDWRRKGIFSSLVTEAQEECRRRNIPQLLFICPSQSSSGKAFLTAAGSQYSFSEYTMELRSNGNTQGKPGVHLRKAGFDDVELLTRLDSLGFGMPPEDAKTFVETAIRQPNATLYIADLQDQPIGKIGVMKDGGTAAIWHVTIRMHWDSTIHAGLWK